MAKRKKKSRIRSFFISLFWLCVAFLAAYFAVNQFLIKPHIYYPGFDIPIPRGFDIHGIDVSKYQQTINWQEVKDMEVKGVKIGFAFMKATEGRLLKDARFKYNWSQAREKGIVRGAYHFFIPGRNPERQAKHFIRTVKLMAGDLPPVLDIEIDRRLPRAQIRKEAKIWADLVEAHYGVKPIIYTNVSYYDRYLSGLFDDYPLWVAHYLEPYKPRTSHDWLFWQHSETGRVNGITEFVDFNVFKGDSSDFRKLLVR